MLAAKPVGPEGEMIDELSRPDWFLFANRTSLFLVCFSSHYGKPLTKCNDVNDSAIVRKTSLTFDYQDLKDLFRVANYPLLN